MQHILINFSVRMSLNKIVSFLDFTTLLIPDEEKLHILSNSKTGLKPS